MQNSWLVIIPPFLVMFLSFATHRVALSLLAGIATAALIFHDFSILPAIVTSLTRFWQTTELANFFSWSGYTQGTALPINLSLIALGIIIELTRHAGGTGAYGRYVRNKIHSAQGAESASVCLSFIFFVDDYLNILTVGSVMHSLTDTFYIARAKLAFLVNAMASPLCLLIPISSWSGIIVAGLDSSGIDVFTSTKTIISAAPFSVYAAAIPFLFYALICISSVMFIIKRKISFGPMYKHEKIAQETHNLFGGKASHHTPVTPEESQKNPALIDFVLPIILLVLSIFGIRFVGKAEMPFALFAGSIISLGITLPFFLLRKKIAYQELAKICKAGVNLMIKSILVVTLAWTFGSIITGDLLTGQFLARHMTHIINITFFPLLFFITSTLTRIAIGSSWATIPLLLQLAIPLLCSLIGLKTPLNLNQIPMIFPTVAAILCGSIAGLHLSPISDNVIMASASTGAYHMDHVKTQQPYLLIICFSTCVSFLLAGLLINYPLILNSLISLGAGLSTSFILFSFFDFLRRQKEKASAK